MKIAIRWLVCGCLLWCSARAAENPDVPEEKGKATDDDLRIRGIFESTLPRTEKKHSLKLIVHPHLGDLTKRDHLRTALGLRYGLSKRWEVTAEADSYFAHGLKKGGFFSASGFSTLHLGTKYNLGDPFKFGWETSVGIDGWRPIGSPPVDVTDGLRHVIPFISLSHQLESHPAWRVFSAFSWDDVTRTSIPGLLEKNALGDDSLKFSGGVLYVRGSVTYTVEAAYATTRLTAAVNRDVYSLRPAVVWVLPPKYTFGARGKWLLGVGLRLSHGSDGNDIGLSAKLRVNFDFKRLLGRKKAAASGP